MIQKLDSMLEDVIAAVRRAERFLGPEDDWVEDDRRIVFEAAQRYFGHLHTFTKEKAPNEYVATVDATPNEVERALMPPYQRNLASNRKYRTYHDGGKQWACGAFVITGLDGPHGYDEQHHVYLFETEDGKTDVHAHRETAAKEGIEHITETHQEHGEERNLFDLFERHGLNYEIRDYE